METYPDVAFFNLNCTWLYLAKRYGLANDATVSHEGNKYNSFNLAHNVESKAKIDQVIELSRSNDC